MSFIPEKDIKLGDGMYWFIGVVEDVNDPLKANRVRVRVFGDHSQSKSRIPLDTLTWGGCLLPTTSSGVSGIGTSIHGLVQGSHVVGFYSDGPNKQLPIIIGSISGISECAPNGEIGFNDPDAVYPLSQYLTEPDVNRLARDCDDGWDTHPAIVHRKDTEITGIQVFSSTWSERQSSGSPVYPLNQTFETPHNNDEPWGSLEEWDATPGLERYHRFHKSGTLIEISENGDELRKVIGKNFEIDLDGKNILVRGDYLVTVEGNKEEYITGNLSQRVDGNIIQEVGGNVTETIGGSHRVTVTGAVLHKTSANHELVTSSGISMIGDTVLQGDLTVSGVVHCSFFDGTAKAAFEAHDN